VRLDLEGRGEQRLEVVRDPVEESSRRAITIPAMSAVTLSGAGAACTTPDDPECEACQ